jgi:dimeric dUTPase (all-alpha-NTP-PPase superfamily)
VEAPDPRDAKIIELQNKLDAAARSEREITDAADDYRRQVLALQSRLSTLSNALATIHFASMPDTRFRACAGIVEAVQLAAQCAKDVEIGRLKSDG